VRRQRIRRQQIHQPEPAWVGEPQSLASLEHQVDVVVRLGGLVLGHDGEAAGHAQVDQQVPLAAIE